MIVQATKQGKVETAVSASMHHSVQMPLKMAAFKAHPLPRPYYLGARMGLMRHASTAVPPAAHGGRRPSRVLLGVVVGTALLGVFVSVVDMSCPLLSIMFVS